MFIVQMFYFFKAAESVVSGLAVYDLAPLRLGVRLVFLSPQISRKGAKPQRKTGEIEGTQVDADIPLRGIEIYNRPAYLKASRSSGAKARTERLSLSEDLTNKSATELVALIRARAVSPVEVVEAHLRRIEEVNPELNAIVTIAGDA